jgi:MFS family permease
MADQRWAPSTRYTWYVAVLLTLVNISANVDQFVLSLLVDPIKRDLGVSDVQISYLQGLAFAIFFSLLALPIARWADRVSRRNIMAVGVALWSLFTALGAASHTFGELFITRVGVGVGEATLIAPGVSLLADYFPAERRGRAMSLMSLGIFLGAGIAYVVGGWVAGLLSVSETWRVPVLGAIHPWQSVFLVVGLPGLGLALLFFTIREPPRGAQQEDPRPLADVARYVLTHRRTFLTQSLGFGCSSLVNFGIAAWLAVFLMRTYGLTRAQAGQVQGFLTMTVGTAAVLIGGAIADRFVRRGRIDGPLRVGIIAALGMLVAGTAYPLMPTAGLAIAWIAVVNFFAALPWGAASAAAAEITPVALRAQGAALYFLVVNLVARSLGPTSVAWLTENVFRDPAAVGRSLAVVNVGDAWCDRLPVGRARFVPADRRAAYRERARVANGNQDCLVTRQPPAFGTSSAHAVVRHLWEECADGAERFQFIIRVDAGSAGRFLVEWVAR